MIIPNLERLKNALSYDPETGIMTWNVSRGTRRAGATAGHLANSGYLIIGFEGLLLYAHRVAWFLYYNVWPTERLDHVDNVQSHNWISNLRYATHSENMSNRKLNETNSTGFKGVHLRKEGRYRAYLNHKGKRYNLGGFATAEEAHEARRLKALELHGEFAREA